MATKPSKPKPINYRVRILQDKARPIPPPPVPQPPPVQKPPPVRTTKPKPAKVKTPPKPKRKKPSRPKPRPKPKSELPPKPDINTHQAQANPNNLPPKEVFGGDINSTIKAGKVAMRVGNTLLKEPEKNIVTEVPPLHPPAPSVEVINAPPRKPKKSIFSLHEVNTPPRFVRRISPNYSLDAQDAGIEGTIVARFVVDQHGRPQRIELSQRLGYDLDRAVIEAIRRSTFQPAAINGRPVACWFTVPFVFRLE
jgi:protein TonB